MDIKRHILTQGVLLSDKTILPIWDSRITFSKSEMYGNQLIVEGERNHTYSVIECIFDLKTKTISTGIELDIYPDLSKIKHKVGMVILFEKYPKHTLTKIIDITFEVFDLQIQKGKKIDNWYLNNLPKDTIIDRESLYAIKVWKPTYVLENGDKTTYDMYLRIIENLDYLENKLGE